MKAAHTKVIITGRIKHTMFNCKEAGVKKTGRDAKIHKLIINNSSSIVNYVDFKIFYYVITYLLPNAVVQKLISNTRNCLRNDHFGGLYGGIRNSISMRVQCCINCGQFLAKFKKLMLITKLM